MDLKKINTRIKFGVITFCLLTVFGFSVSAQSYNYVIEFIGKPEIFDDTSKVALQFNLLDVRNNTRIQPIYSDFKNVEVEDSIISELRIKSIFQPYYLSGSFEKLKDTVNGNTPKMTSTGSLNKDEITVSVLVDRSGSMTHAKINKVYEVLTSLLNSMPDSSVFISWFNNDISASLPVTRGDFNVDVIPVPEDPVNSHTALNNAIYTKLLEFDSAAVIPNTKYEPIYFRNELIYKRSTPQNYLIVLTDGRDESEKIPKYQENEFLSIDKDKLFETLENYTGESNKVEIWMIGIKDIGDDLFFDEETMKTICEISGNPDNYRRGGEDQLPEIFNEVIDDILPDYKMFIYYPDKTTFKGYNRELRLRITFPDNKRARGSIRFAKGSKASPHRFYETNIYETIIIGVIIGILFLLIVIILIQVIVPLTSSILFKVKHVNKYKPDTDTEKLSCSWCKQEIAAKEKAVFCCEHIAHWNCWKENSHQCPNYPDICEKGKQNYFDINDPFGRDDTDSVVKQNKKRFMRWIVWGIIAGLITWLCYQSLLSAGIFDGLIQKILPENVDVADQVNSVEKFSPLLLLGSILGFFLSMFLLYLEEFRRINLAIAFKLLLRSIIGAIVGFVAFLGGSYILILLGIFHTTLVDVIPWILFGPMIGYYLSVKTTLSASHGVIGGLFSILFSFITLYLINSFDEEFMMVLSLCIYGCGLGMAISTVRQMAEKYFLVLSNAPVKNKEFPLHKWISKSADFGMFSIGKGNKNIIKMDWEKGDVVSEDIHAVIYLERSNKDYPVITIRDIKNKTYLNDHMLMRPEKEYILHNGDTFKIGETLFKYIEKQS
ncbi:MAG: FHA domain-containing protein [Mariniphaga sp.]|nr:FHA domain-containing protein [Mariniphaga sp.]